MTNKTISQLPIMDGYLPKDAKYAINHNGQFLNVTNAVIKLIEKSELLQKRDENKVEDCDYLHMWFGLSYASFLTLPRVLMQEMPLEWKNKMAALLEEYDNTYYNQPSINTRVLPVKDGKYFKWPKWLLNYRRPDREEINKCKYQFRIINGVIVHR